MNETSRHILTITLLLAGFALFIKISSPSTYAQEPATTSTARQLIIERRMTKVTASECMIRGGKFAASTKISSRDIVDCLLPQLTRRGNSQPSPNSRIVGSVYDYLFEEGTEKPGCGLYTYVLFPEATSRAEHLLDVIIATMSFVELSGLACKNVNVLYLPTNNTSWDDLVELARNNELVQAALLTKEYYDYVFARQILGEVCLEPPETLRKACATDLSRGPYLLTYSKPVSAVSPLSPPFLFADLSKVHERAFGEFVAAYKEQVKRTDYSDRKRIDTLRLSLLNVVLTAADWVDPIRGAVADTLHLTLYND